METSPPVLLFLRLANNLTLSCAVDSVYLMTWQSFSQDYSLEKLLHVFQEMSSDTAIVCNGQAWDTVQMVKLIMVTPCHTTACFPAVRERARNIPGGRWAAQMPSQEGGAPQPSCQQPSPHCELRAAWPAVTAPREG